MLTQESFIKRIKQPNSPSWLHVGVDTQDENQLYIAVNGGMNNINCAPIESYLTEIKACAVAMIDEGELFITKNAKPLRIGQGRSAYFYTLKTTSESSHTFRFSFANLFVKSSMLPSVLLDSRSISLNLSLFVIFFLSNNSNSDS
mgnify:CR=1 FL=1